MRIGALLKFYESGYNRFGDEKYNKIKEHGFDCVDFNIADTETEIYKVDEIQFIKILEHEKNLAQKAGIEIWQVHGPWRAPKDSTESDRNERMEKMQKAILATSQLGCRNFVIHPIMPFGPKDLHTENKRDTWNMNCSFMKKLLETAKKCNVTICLENMPFRSFSLSRPVDILQFVKEINDENFKICLDTGHVAIFEDLSVGNEVRRLGGDIKVLHVHDNMGHRDSHQPPYTGIVDWKDFSKALKEINFNGVLSLETSPSRDLSTVEFENQCKELAKKAKRIIK